MLGLFSLGSPGWTPAQTPGGNQAGTSQSGTTQTFTLGTTARLVVEDVLVTDSKGSPVKGLPESAFHVMDDGATQKIATFDESGRGSEQAPGPAAQPGVFSNASQSNPQGQTVVLLIDTVGMEIPDQMYLRLQMLKYLESLPAGIQMAVFRTYGGAAPLLVQSLTMNRGLVVKAVNNSIPTIPRRTIAQFDNAVAEVANISQYLGQMPGRKQLIWFSGRFPLFVSPLSNGIEPANYEKTQQALRVAYRLLERARVEVFPIDVRGVTQGGPPLNPPAGEASPTVGEGAIDASGYDAMDAMAASTGGRAFYSTNGLAQALSNAVETGSHSYTLSYRPSTYSRDGKWHTVKLTVDGPYKVSYRQGYYADDPAGTSATQLAASAKAAGIGDVATAQVQSPITFEVQLQRGPGAGAHGTHRLTVEYGIHSSDLQFSAVAEGKQEAQIKVAALAYDGEGDVVSSSVDDVTTHFDPRQMGIVGRLGVPMIQHIEVGKGAKFLLLAVLDLKSGRTGTVQLTVDSARAAAR